MHTLQNDIYKLNAQFHLSNVHQLHRHLGCSVIKVYEGKFQSCNNNSIVERHLMSKIFTIYSQGYLFRQLQMRGLASHRRYTAGGII